MLTSLTMLAIVAVPGVPEPPTPGPAPLYWAGWGNDFFCPVTDKDDYRTNNIRIGIWTDYLVVGIDYGMLTLRNSGRLDELTTTIGYSACNEYYATLAAGLGMRFRGSYGGEALQNGFHDLLNADHRHEPYEDAQSEPGGWLLLMVRGDRFGDSFLEFTLSAFEASDVGQHDIGLRLVYQPDDSGTIWIGPRLCGRKDNSSPIGAVVAEQEDGVCLEGGLAGNHWSFSMLYNASADSGYGELALRF